MTVTVIIPTYNRAAYLREALDSVAAQSYRPIEVVVVDDGSTDHTETAVAEFAAERANSDAKFSCRLIKQNRGGPLAARNKALTQSSGEFVQFLDDDDTLYPSKLKAQADLLTARTDVDAAVCQVMYADANLIASGSSCVLNDRGETDMVRFFLDLRHDVAIHAPLFRRRAIELVGGWDERVRHGGEVELHLRMAIAGAKFAFMPDVLASVRCHNAVGRLTLNEKLTPADAERDFYLRIIEFSESRRGGRRDDALREGVADRLFGIARRHYACGRRELGYGCLLAAREICPSYSPLRLRLYAASPLGGWIGAVAEYCSDLVGRGRRKAARMLHPQRVA